MFALGEREQTFQTETAVEAVHHVHQVGRQLRGHHGVPGVETDLHLARASVENLDARPQPGAFGQEVFANQDRELSTGEPKCG